MKSLNFILLTFCILSLAGCASQQATPPAAPEPAVKGSEASTPPAPTAPTPSPSKTEAAPSTDTASAKGILGKWLGQFPTETGGKAATTIAYKADGTQLQHMDSEGHSLDIEAKYSLKNGELTQTFVSAKVDGKKIDSPPEQPRKFHVEIKGDIMVMTAPGDTEGQSFQRIK